jgi:hypothetical protein
MEDGTGAAPAVVAVGLALRRAPRSSSRPTAASSPSKDNDTCPDCGCFEAELVEVGSAPSAGKDRDPMYDRLDGALDTS